MSGFGRVVQIPIEQVAGGCSPWVLWGGERGLPAGTRLQSMYLGGRKKMKTIYDGKLFTRAALLFLVAASMLSAGCMLSPYGEQKYSMYEDIPFNGYASKPGATIYVKAYNYQTQQYEVIAQTTASSSVSLSKNTISNNPDMYYWSVSSVIASQGDRSTQNRWLRISEPCNDLELNPEEDSDGDADGSVGSSASGICVPPYEARVRAQEENGLFPNLLTFNDEGFDCLQKHIDAGKDFYNAAGLCKSDDWPDLVIRTR